MREINRRRPPTLNRHPITCTDRCQTGRLIIRVTGYGGSAEPGGTRDIRRRAYLEIEYLFSDYGRGDADETTEHGYERFGNLVRKISER